MNGWMARTTLEMLGQAGLGYSFDNFADDSTDAYGDSIKMFLYVSGVFTCVYHMTYDVSVPAARYSTDFRFWPSSPCGHRPSSQTGLPAFSSAATLSLPTFVACLTSRTPWLVAPKRSSA